ncbi:hypothetical protein QTP88_005768 [Uroleucon formosanum]
MPDPPPAVRKWQRKGYYWVARVVRVTELQNLGAGWSCGEQCLHRRCRDKRHLTELIPERPSHDNRPVDHPRRNHNHYIGCAEDQCQTKVTDIIVILFIDLSPAWKQYHEQDIMRTSVYLVYLIAAYNI